MVKPLFEVQVDPGVHRGQIKAKQLDRVRSSVHGVLERMKTSGEFKIRCITKTAGVPALAGKLRIGICDRSKREIELTHQLSTQEQRYKLAMFVPHNHDPALFFDRFCKSAEGLPGIVIGVKKNGHVVAESEEADQHSSNGGNGHSATPPIRTETASISATPATSELPKKIRKKKQLDLLKSDTCLAFMEILAEDTDQNGIVTRDQISHRMQELEDGISKMSVGQRIRGLVERGELEPRGDKEFFILKISELRKAKPVAAEEVSVIVAPKQSGITQAEALVDEGQKILRTLAEQYVKAKDTKSALEPERIRLREEITEAQAELFRLQDALAKLDSTEKGFATVLMPGGVHEMAARQMGLIQ